jgi:hypothetical protein
MRIATRTLAVLFATSVGAIVAATPVLARSIINNSAAMSLSADAITKTGILDGSGNDLNVLDDLSALNTAINSDPQSSENNNVNTRANGHGNNSAFQ